MAETPNLDVLGIEMSLIFGKCRLAFFGVFKPKRAISMAFFFLDILTDFTQKSVQNCVIFGPAAPFFWPLISTYKNGSERAVCNSGNSIR